MSYNLNNDLFVSAYDCCPFWSAKFGYTLLNAVDYRERMTVLDIGTGTGFPAIELAERLGPSSFVYAVDIWQAAIKRAELKAEQLEVKNIKFFELSVLDMPFAENTFDLITSNNCINNIGDYGRVLQNCHRILKPGGELIQVYNLPETMKEFYDLYRELLAEKGMELETERLNTHISSKRRNMDECLKTTEKAGFFIGDVIRESFVWPFANGTSLMNYSFVKMAFLPGWKEIIDAPQKEMFFAELEDKINIYSESNKGIRLTIPYVCISAKKLRKQQEFCGLTSV